MRLENKVAIITGAASGIGKQTALIFAEEGAKVAIADINEQAGEEVATMIRELGGNAVFIKTDVSNTEQVANLIKTTINYHGKIDILINNSGIVRDAFLTDVTDEQLALVIGVNQIGPTKCARAVAKIMMDQETKGVIINTSSVIGIYGNTGQTVYSMTKAAMIALTKTLSKELGKKGVRVNAVAPGFIATPMTAGVPEKVLQIMKEKTPLKKLGEPKDVAYAYLYLASDEASFVNGAVLAVDGGLVI